MVLFVKTEIFMSKIKNVLFWLPKLIEFGVRFYFDYQILVSFLTKVGIFNFVFLFWNQLLVFLKWVFFKVKVQQNIFPCVTLMRLSLGAKKLKYLKKSYKLFCTFILKNTQIFEFLCAISYTAGQNKSDVFTTAIFFWWFSLLLFKYLVLVSHSCFCLMLVDF